MNACMVAAMELLGGGCAEGCIHFSCLIVQLLLLRLVFDISSE